MPFKKGQITNPKGRGKGTPNVKTKQWDEFGRQLMEENTDSVAKIMKELADSALDKDKEKLMQYYFQLIEYFRPRQSRVESKSEIEVKDTVIRVKYEKINGK